MPELLSPGQTIDLSVCHPSDPLTLQPLVVVSKGIQPRIFESAAECHHLYRPRRSHKLARGRHCAPETAMPYELPGMALRACLGEAIEVVPHDVLHNIAPNGPDISGTAEGQHKRIIMAITQARSRLAIDVRGGGTPRVIQLDDAEFKDVYSNIGMEYFWNKKRNEYGQRVVGRYLLHRLPYECILTSSMGAREAFLDASGQDRLAHAGSVIRPAIAALVSVCSQRLEICRQEGNMYGDDDPVDKVLAVIPRGVYVEFIPKIEKVLLSARPKQWAVPSKVA